MTMQKQEVIEAIAALYQVFNMADSDNPSRPEWTRPEMANTCCRPLEADSSGVAKRKGTQRLLR